MVKSTFLLSLLFFILRKGVRGAERERGREEEREKGKCKKAKPPPPNFSFLLLCPMN